MNNVMRAFVLGASAFLLTNGATLHTAPQSGRPVSPWPEAIVVASKAGPPGGEDANRGRECVAAAAIVTRELNVQVYRLSAVGGGLEVATDQEVITYSRNGDVVRSATTNRDGFVRFGGLDPGDYILHMPTGLLEPLYQSVRITRGNAGPARTMAAISNMMCGRVCAVDGIRGPLPSPPACLFHASP
jgi:hypothetical protein